MAGTAEPLIGVINAGSSSLKFSFYDGETRVLSARSMEAAHSRG